MNSTTAQQSLEMSFLEDLEEERRAGMKSPTGNQINSELQKDIPAVAPPTHTPKQKKPKQKKQRPVRGTRVIESHTYLTYLRCRTERTYSM